MRNEAMQTMTTTLAAALLLAVAAYLSWPVTADTPPRPSAETGTRSRRDKPEVPVTAPAAVYFKSGDSAV